MVKNLKISKKAIALIAGSAISLFTLTGCVSSVEETQKDKVVNVETSKTIKVDSAESQIYIDQTNGITSSDLVNYFNNTYGKTYDFYEVDNQLCQIGDLAVLRYANKVASRAENKYKVEYGYLDPHTGEILIPAGTYDEIKVVYNNQLQTTTVYGKNSNNQKSIQLDNANLKDISKLDTTQNIVQPTIDPNTPYLDIEGHQVPKDAFNELLNKDFLDIEAKITKIGNVDTIKMYNKNVGFTSYLIPETLESIYTDSNITYMGVEAIGDNLYVKFFKDQNYADMYGNIGSRNLTGYFDINTLEEVIPYKNIQKVMPTEEEGVVYITYANANQDTEFYNIKTSGLKK